MSFSICLEEGERLIANLSFVPSRKFAVSHAPVVEAFYIAISDRAIFLPRKKFFAVKDPNYWERVPLNQVINVQINRIRPYLAWALASIMIVGGGITTGLMLWPVFRGEQGQFSEYPPAVAFVGFVIPFIARRRSGLSISMVSEVFAWKPPLLVDKTSRRAVEQFLTHAADAFRQVGINVNDERKSPLTIS